MVSVIFGNQRCGKSPFTLLNQLAKTAPSICTGTTQAFVFAAMNAGPSYTFISRPVTVMRPSGKMPTGLPLSIKAIACFNANGFPVSMVRWLITRSNTLNSGCAAICVCTIHHGSTGRKAPSRMPSMND